MADLKDANTRVVECIFLEEFFKCLEKIDIDISYLRKKLEYDKAKKKNFNSSSIAIEYYLSTNNIRQCPNLNTFVKVRKDNAKVCYENDVEPETYSKQETKDIVRKIQLPLIKHFEYIVSKYDKKQLHSILLSYLAYYTHKKRVDYFRYDFSNDTTLTNEARNTSAEIIISDRENIKDTLKI